MGSADGGGKVGDVNAVSEAEDDDEEDDDDDDEEEAELLEEREPFVPLRTSCRSPTTGYVKREGEASPDTEDSGVLGGELGVPHTRALGSWYSFFTTMRVMCRPFRASRFDAYSSVPVRCGGRLCVSRMDLPASRGEEI